MLDRDLTINDFSSYFHQGRLGKLSFPNGISVTPDVKQRISLLGERNANRVPFFINLEELYRLSTNWTPNNLGNPPQDLIAIIAFGSAVRYPGIKEVTNKRKRFFLFGDEVLTVSKKPIMPWDADFFVISGQSRFEDFSAPASTIDVYEQGGPWVEKGGIQVINVGIDQLLRDTSQCVTVSITAIEEGIPIFFDSELEEIIRQTGLIRKNPRRLQWILDQDEKYMDRTDLLNGKIF